MVEFIPNPKAIMRTDGNAYALDGDTLMVAPIKTDGSIDHDQWAEFAFDFLDVASGRFGASLTTTLAYLAAM